VVTPVQHFLSVDVKADRDQYQPREEGTLSITTRDTNGKAVSAEIALGLIDESVKYIQQDYAGDPRQFYYGEKRPHAIQTQSTFNQKTYATLVEVRSVEDFEGTVQLALGINGSVCYRAFILTNPTRLVIDVQAA